MTASEPQPGSWPVGPPHPETGWSREVHILRNVTVVPPNTPGFRQVCGVWGPEGDEPLAGHWRSDCRFSLPLTSAPIVRRKLAGRHLWGGLIFDQFGHFILETCSRLWAAEAQDVESVIFIPKRRSISDFSGFQKEFYSLLGTGRPYRLANRATMVEELLVPGQGYGIGEISSGTPEHRAMLRKMSAGIEARGPEKIYVSRTRNNSFGSVLNEAAIEENFRAQGYEIVHPQLIPVREQIAIFKGARRVAGLDGSAFHLAAMVAPPDHETCIILRRSTRDVAHIVRQYVAMTGRAPTVVDALDANWVQYDKPRPNHLSWGEINHRRLARSLREAGYLSSSATWEVPAEQASAAAIASAEGAAGCPLLRLAVSAEE